MILLWALLLICAAICFAYYLYVTLSYKARVIEKYFDGPSRLPLVGNALEVVNKNILDVLMKFSKIYPSRVRLWLGTDVIVALYKVKDIEAVLKSSKHITKSSLYKFGVPWLADGLLLSTGAKWHSRRKIITPAFHTKVLESFFDIFESNGDILIEKLRNFVNKDSFDVACHCQLYSMDNICETVMGISMNSQKNSDSVFVQTTHEMIRILIDRAMKPWLMPDFIFYKTKQGLRHNECIKILHDHTNETIRSRRQVVNKEVAEGVDEFGSRKRLAFLDLLLKSDSGLTDDDLREEVGTFLVAGEDTVTAAISFTLYALSQNPLIQENAYKEQMEIFGHSKRSTTVKDLNEMKYLERVIKEVLRMYAPSPVIGRYIGEDLTLDDGAVIPRGTEVFLLILALHMDPEIWDEPSKFNPDRFLPENGTNRSQYAFVPFSAGPRNCIGQKYAMLQLKSCVSKVIRHFSLLPCSFEDEVILSTEASLISLNGVNIRLQERSVE